MPLKVIAPDKSTISIHSPKDFEAVFRGNCRTPRRIKSRFWHLLPWLRLPSAPVRSSAHLLCTAKVPRTFSCLRSHLFKYAFAAANRTRCAGSGNRCQNHRFFAGEEFCNSLFKIGYLCSIGFKDSKTQEKIEKRCAKALRKGWITSRQKWLGDYHAQGIRGNIPLDLTIAWIDEEIGYGVWTNVDIPAQAYIGEYTGILRKRFFCGRWKNHYCFDYNIGEGRSSGYVIDAQDFGNYTRFINHSFEPNLEPVSTYCDGLIHVILYAPKFISAGTQLCYDYGEDYWKKRGIPKQLEKWVYTEETSKIGFFSPL